MADEDATRAGDDALAVYQRALDALCAVALAEGEATLGIIEAKPAGAVDVLRQLTPALGECIAREADDPDLAACALEGAAKSLDEVARAIRDAS
jgi:hypothetical protein